MLEPFIYPVSGVMKLWHYLLHSTFGLDDSLAWVLSLFGLVITVRALITPFFWIMLKSGRIGIILRPQLKALDKQLKENPTPEMVEEVTEKRKQIQKENGFSTAAGCVPALIQIPFFLGLYQVLLRMARPKEGLDAQTHQPIGMLNSTDVHNFLQARIDNIPMPAYRTMPAERLAEMNTTSAAVWEFVLPIILGACIFTTVNMIMSTVRSMYSVDYHQNFSVRMTRFMIVMTILAPLMLFSFGSTGPAPVAIVLYWLANNFWTFTQNVVMYLLLHFKYPYPEEFHEYQKQSKAERKAKKKEAKDTKHRIRRLRRKAIASADARQELHTFRAELAAKEHAEREHRKKQSAARREYQHRRQQARVEEIKARRAAKRREKAEASGKPYEPPQGDKDSTAKD